MQRFLIFVLPLILFAFSAEAERPFVLYQPIIDKCPFGPPPDDPTVIPEKMSSSGMTRDGKDLAKEQEQLQKAVSVSALIEKPDGKIMVGFSDASASKTPVHYYLAVGESKDGWLVKSADILAKNVVLEKDSVEIERSLGQSAQGQGAATAKTPQHGAHPPAAEAAPGRRSSLLSSRLPAGGSLLRMKSRRQLKLEEEESQRRASQEQLDKIREAEASKREQERQQLEAERAEQRQMLLDLKDELKKQREAQVQQNNNVAPVNNAEETH